MNKLKKAMAILLAVLFLVSLTAAATSAIPCKGPAPKCPHHDKAICINGHWKCLETPCKGPKPVCIHGTAICINGHWYCK